MKMDGGGLVVNDITQLNPVDVWAIAVPRSIEDIQKSIKQANCPISIGGGHFSMGGQTASPGSLHLDMRLMNEVICFNPQEKTIRVQAGIRWCDLQKFIDPHDLSVKIMQTYANFTVGGSLSVNVHGRYVGFGPIASSVRNIKLVTADGNAIDCSPAQNSELFHASIGGYGALGVIVEAEFELTDNTRVERIRKLMPTKDYPEYFKQNVRNTGSSVFHNADLYPPHYSRANAVTWVKTIKAVTHPNRLQPRGKRYLLQKYFFWAFTEMPFGKWRREHIIDPLTYVKPAIHWRNYEAGYDAAELEPVSRKSTSYVLQEYFIPIDNFGEFVRKMTDIFQRYSVNVINVSVRHAYSDPDTRLSWTRGETFAFVVYYKQRTRNNAIARVGVWTRELINAALSCSGTYYLPYQLHATSAQFHAAYPRAVELFDLKKKHDPHYRFRNALWDKYYGPRLGNAESGITTMHQGALMNSDFHAIYNDVTWSDNFYKFLQNIYRLYPEDRFHTLIIEATKSHSDDEEIYRYIQHNLKSIRPFFGLLTHAIPSLMKQKREMARQTIELLGDRTSVNGYVEIGSTGRYISQLRKHIRFQGRMILINDSAPTYSPADIVERGQLRVLGEFYPLLDYSPLSTNIPDESVELVTCYIGLHHIAPSRIDAFVQSIARILKPSGMFILRDHDVKSPIMNHFVSLAHTVFNAGLGAAWKSNQDELRHFASVQDWSDRLANFGLIDTGKRLVQDHDPSDNVLMSFIKRA